MTGFNMPPGCSPSDIPGNRPEDLAEEARRDHIHTRLTLVTGFAVLNEVEQSDLEDAVIELADEAVEDARSDALADNALAHDLERRYRIVCLRDDPWLDPDTPPYVWASGKTYSHDEALIAADKIAKSRWPLIVEAALAPSWVGENG